MTKSISLRVKPSQLARIDARASELGFDDRSKYLTAILERDLEQGTPGKRRLASEDLLGAYESSGVAATNANTRRLLAQRLRTAHAKPR